MHRKATILVLIPALPVGLVANLNAGGWLIFKAHDIARAWWKRPCP